MKVLITGANGFIGKNVQVHLKFLKINVVLCTRENQEDLSNLLDGVEFIFHLAGVNRPKDPDDFRSGNTHFTQFLCDLLIKQGKKIPILYTSSIQAELDNAYGKSKLEAENVLREYSIQMNSPIYIYRLPNVFGKWARPNYNSAVATFCHNISKGLPIEINDRNAIIRLVYIDDVVTHFLDALKGKVGSTSFVKVIPEYEITVGRLADKIYQFKSDKELCMTEPVGTGFDRALYSTYLSYFVAQDFSYRLVKKSDSRGDFVEMLKTNDSGQFSYFSAHPGVTRGGHYHHTKTEKFLVLKGEALFKFRHVLTNEYYELKTKGGDPVVVETIPGWTHDITNIGTDEMFVMLWANEIFDPNNPDTFMEKV